MEPWPARVVHHDLPPFHSCSGESVERWRVMMHANASSIS